MDKEQMNDYLKSIGGLKTSWGKFERTINESTFFDVDEGWYPIIKELIDGLIKLGWNKNIVQVKEKFGGLRFYIDEGSDEMYKLISDTENQSYETCEVCGNEGKLRTDIGWYLTLCDEHYTLKLQNKKL